MFTIQPINERPKLFPFTVKMVDHIDETVNYGHKLHNIKEAWKETKGEDVIVSVIDTGLPDHPDLDGQILKYKNFTSSPVADKVGHSTHVASIISAVENGFGVVGLAPKSKLIIAKALGDDGSGSDESIARAIRWSVEEGADIINMSLGGPAAAEHFMSRTKQACQDAYDAGVIIFAASGNENDTKINTPARFPTCLSVGAIDRDRRKANFSNAGQLLDFVGAGVDIDGCYLNKTYAQLSGTSMATPQLVGLATLILSAHKRTTNHTTPINNATDMKEHLLRIVNDLGETGFDREYGHGIPIYSVDINSTHPIEIIEGPQIPQKKTFWERLFGWLF